MSVAPACKVSVVLVAIGFIPTLLHFLPSLANPLQDTKNGMLQSKQKEVSNKAAAQPFRDPLTNYDYSHSKQYLDLRVKDCTFRLQNNPNDATQLILRGVTYWHLEEFPKALADLKKAISLSPSKCSPSVYRIIGECYA